MTGHNRAASTYRGSWRLFSLLFLQVATSVVVVPSRHKRTPLTCGKASRHLADLYPAAWRLFLFDQEATDQIPLAMALRFKGNANRKPTQHGSESRWVFSLGIGRSPQIAVAPAKLLFYHLAATVSGRASAVASREIAPLLPAFLIIGASVRCLLRHRQPIQPTESDLRFCKDRIAPTILQKEVFGENVERLSHCGE